MSLKDLEKKAIKIRVHGDLQKIVQIWGSVEFVEGFNEPIKISSITSSTITGKTISSYLTGYQKKLHIALDPESNPEEIKLLNFKGTSPVRGGDKIKVGLILDEYFERYRIGNILYLGILKQEGSSERIDYMDGYNPTQGDAKKLGYLKPTYLKQSAS